MSSKNYYFKFHQRVFLSSSTVKKMSSAARGIYVTLLCHQAEDGYIENCKRTMMRLADCTASEWKQFEPFLDHVFPLFSEDGRRNPRLEQEMKATSASGERKNPASAINGLRGGRPKKTYSEDEEKPIQEPIEKPIPKPNQEPKENLKKPKYHSNSNSKEKELNKFNSKNENLPDSSEPEGSEPLADELALGPILRWFELGENLRASNLVKLIRGAPGYGDFEPTEQQFTDFLTWIDAEAPDEDAVLGLVESFANAAAIHANKSPKSKPKYVDVIATLRTWARRAKTEWTQAKAAQARAKKEQMWLEEAEARAGKAPAPKVPSKRLEIEVPFAGPAEPREVVPAAVDRILADVGAKRAAEMPPKPRTPSLEEQKRMLEAAG